MGGRLPQQRNTGPVHSGGHPYLRTARLCGVGAILIGISGLLGWVFGISELNSIIPGLKPIAISASIIFIILGGVQYLAATPPCHRRLQIVLLVVASFITLFGLLEIITLLTGLDVSIEDAILRHYPALYRNPQVQIAPIAMILVFLISLAQALHLAQCVARTPRRELTQFVGIIGTLVILISLASLMGYLYGTPFLLGREILPIAALAALAALLSGIGLVALAGNTVFPLDQFTGPSTQARLYRAFLPLTVGLMLLLSIAQFYLTRLTPFHPVVITAILIAVFVIIVGVALRQIAGSIGSVIDRAVAERRQAEEELRRSEAQLATIIDNVSEGVVVSTTDGNLLQWNRAALAMHGLASLEEARRKLPEFDSYFELHTLDGQYIPLDQWPMSRVLRGEALRDWDLRLKILRTGRERIFSYSGSMVYDTEGHPLMAVLTINDVTDRRRAEGALRESEERFRMMANALPQLAWMAKPDGYIYWYNQRWYAYTGTTPEQMEGWGWQRVHNPETLPKVLEQWKGSIATGQPFDMVFPLRGADGRFRPFLTRVMPLKDAEGRVIEWFGTNTDVTELQETQEALRQLNATLEQKVQERTAALEASNEALRQSEERFRLMIESVKDYAIIMLDPSGRVTSWNAGAERSKGYHADEILGKSFTVFYPPEAVAAGKPQHELELALANGRFEEENWRVRKDGSRFWASVIITPLYDADGTHIGFVKVTRDISERRRAEEQLRALNADLLRRTEELETSNKELEGFSYSVAHDLRSPLRSIDGFSKYLLEHTAERLNAREQDYLQRMRAAAQRMGRLIDDLLNLARISRMPMTIEPIDLSALAGEIATELHKRDPDRRVTVEITPGMMVQADRDLLRIALTHLLENAWKFTGTREQARITVSMQQEGDRPVYFVRDNGVGFDMTYVDKLFQPFHRLHTEEEFPGTGIGLALVQRIIARHGGQVWAEGAVGHGATFYFTLGETTQ